CCIAGSIYRSPNSIRPLLLTRNPSSSKLEENGSSSITGDWEVIDHPGGVRRQSRILPSFLVSLMSDEVWKQAVTARREASRRQNAQFRRASSISQSVYTGCCPGLTIIVGGADTCPSNQQIHSTLAMQFANWLIHADVDRVICSHLTHLDHSTIMDIMMLRTKVRDKANQSSTPAASGGFPSVKPEATGSQEDSSNITVEPSVPLNGLATSRPRPSDVTTDSVDRNRLLLASLSAIGLPNPLSACTTLLDLPSSMRLLHPLFQNGSDFGYEFDSVVFAHHLMFFGYRLLICGRQLLAQS
ncbi:hypothetical protein FBUS_09926, partial [Fasciolopsis buskii]